MKKLAIIFACIASFTCCQEVEPKHFDCADGVYFSNYASAGVLSDRIEVTFAYIDGAETIVEVGVQLLGRSAEKDRRISLEAVSDNAVEGRDYSLPESVSLPEGSSSVIVPVTLYRSDALRTNTLSVTLRLRENEMFIIPFQSQTTPSGAAVSADTYTISFNDQFTVAPEGWSKSYIGTFSQQKFELICRVMDMPRSEFTVRNGISAARWMYIQSVMMNYVIEQQNLRNSGQEYDPMAFGADGRPLSFIS